MKELGNSIRNDNQLSLCLTLLWIFSFISQKLLQFDINLWSLLHLAFDEYSLIMCSINFRIHSMS